MPEHHDSTRRRRPKTGSFPILCAKPGTPSTRNDLATQEAEDDLIPPSQEALHCDWLTAIGFADRTARTPTSREPLEVHVRVAQQPFDVRSAGSIVSARCRLPDFDSDSIGLFVNGSPIGSWTSRSGCDVEVRFLLDEAIRSNKLQVNSANTLTVLGRTPSGRPFWGECGFNVVRS